MQLYINLLDFELGRAINIQPSAVKQTTEIETGRLIMRLDWRVCTNIIGSKESSENNQVRGGESDAIYLFLTGLSISLVRCSESLSK